MNSTIEEYNTPAGIRYVVSRMENAKRKRSFFKHRNEAEACAALVDSAASTAEKIWQALPQLEMSKLMEAYYRAKERGLDPIALLLNHQPTVQALGPSLSQVISELLQVKARAQKSPARITALRLTLGDFARGREDQRLGALGLADVERYLESKNLASWKTLRANLSTLFNFAIRRQYLGANPCARLEGVKVHRSPVEILTQQEVETCVAAICAVRPNPVKGLPAISYRHALPWFVLTCLCGLRPDEARQIARKEINIEEGWIRVEVKKTKVRTGRIVYPLPEAMALLKASLPAGRLPLSKESKRRVIKFLRAALGRKQWVKDLTRHTAASHWLAVCRSAKDCAESLGHSEAILERDYKSLVTVKEGQAFWAAVAAIAEKIPAPLPAAAPAMQAA